MHCLLQERKKKIMEVKNSVKFKVVFAPIFQLLRGRSMSVRGVIIYPSLFQTCFCQCSRMSHFGELPDVVLSKIAKKRQNPQ